MICIHYMVILYNWKYFRSLFLFYQSPSALLERHRSLEATLDGLQRLMQRLILYITVEDVMLYQNIIHHSLTMERLIHVHPIVLLLICLFQYCRQAMLGTAMWLSNHVLHTLILPKPLHPRGITLASHTHTHYSCHHTPRACQTPTSLYGCSIKINTRHISLDFMLCTLFCVLLACVLSRH